MIWDKRPKKWPPFGGRCTASITFWSAHLIIYDSKKFWLRFARISSQKYGADSSSKFWALLADLCIEETKFQFTFINRKLNFFGFIWNNRLELRVVADSNNDIRRQNDDFDRDFVPVVPPYKSASHSSFIHDFILNTYSRIFQSPVIVRVPKSVFGAEMCGFHIIMSAYFPPITGSKRFSNRI
jgi:hypothetical protein